VGRGPVQRCRHDTPLAATPATPRHGEVVRGYRGRAGGRLDPPGVSLIKCYFAQETTISPVYLTSCADPRKPYSAGEAAVCHSQQTRRSCRFLLGHYLNGAGTFSWLSLLYTRPSRRARVDVSHAGGLRKAIGQPPPP
jgi:hypothetical protein